MRRLLRHLASILTSGSSPPRDYRVSWRLAVAFYSFAAADVDGRQPEGRKFQRTYVRNNEVLSGFAHICSFNAAARTSRHP